MVTSSRLPSSSAFLPNLVGQVSNLPLPTLPLQSSAPTPRHRRGVALVDVIVATVILGIALGVLLNILGRAIDAQSTGEKLQTAALLLDEQLNLVLMRGPDDYASRYPTEGTCDSPFTDYRYKLTIRAASGGQPFEVAASVLWTVGSRERSVEATTLIAPRLGDDPDPVRTPDAVVERLQ